MGWAPNPICPCKWGKREHRRAGRKLHENKVIDWGDALSNECQ